jgi:proline dehydrogenase
MFFSWGSRYHLGGLPASLFYHSLYSQCVFGRLLSSALPLLPRSIVARVARRYIAGDTTESAIETVQALNARGWAATVDLLGEEIIEPQQAQSAATRVLRVIETLDERQCQSGVSIKLSQLGIRIDEQLCMSHLTQIIECAQARDRFVRIDMEDSSLTTQTLNIYQSLRKEYGGARLGTVVQACLYRTEDDIASLLKADVVPDLRICKGIYRESEDVAYTDKTLITQNFVRLVTRCLSAGAKIAIATHDVQVIDPVCQFIAAQGIDKRQYEFQALLGVPIEGILDRLVADGHSVRVYVPFGAQWYTYSTRRLKENPEIATHVFKAMFRRLD